MGLQKKTRGGAFSLFSRYRSGLKVAKHGSAIVENLQKQRNIEERELKIEQVYRVLVLPCKNTINGRILILLKNMISKKNC